MKVLFLLINIIFSYIPRPKELDRRLHPKRSNRSIVVPKHSREHDSDFHHEKGYHRGSHYITHARRHRNI